MGRKRARNKKGLNSGHTKRKRKREKEKTCEQSDWRGSEKRKAIGEQKGATRDRGRGKNSTTQQKEAKKRKCREGTDLSRMALLRKCNRNPTQKPHSFTREQKRKQKRGKKGREKNVDSAKMMSAQEGGRDAGGKRKMIARDSEYVRGTQREREREKLLEFVLEDVRRNSVLRGR